MNTANNTTEAPESPHDQGYRLAEEALCAMGAADNDVQAVEPLHKALRDFAELMATLDFDGRYMAAGGFTSAIYIQLLDGLRYEAAMVSLKASQKAPGV